MTDDVLVATRDHGVLTLTLNRPDRRNALDSGLTRALGAALTDAQKDDDVRAIVLAANGPAFCAGGDLKAMVKRRGDANATLARHRDELAPVARALLLGEKPVVARVHGDAVGAGAVIAAACDFAFIADSARFGFTFTRVGIAPDSGASWLLPRLVGLRAARELTLLPDLLPAADAARLGLVTAVVPPAELDAVVQVTADRLAGAATRALGFTRRAFAEALGAPLEEALAAEAAYGALAAATADHSEGVDAVLEKRGPAFSGT